MGMKTKTLVKRFQGLMGNVNFYSDYDRALSSPDHLLKIGKHNLKELTKIDAMDGEHRDRIESLLWNILGTVLQEEAIAKYGNTDDKSIRQVLNYWYNQPDNREYCERLIKSARQGVMNLNLTEGQLQDVNKCLDKLPDVIMDILAKKTGHIRLLPRSHANSIAIALADMIKEAGSCSQ